MWSAFLLKIKLSCTVAFSSKQDLNWTSYYTKNVLFPTRALTLAWCWLAKPSPNTMQQSAVVIFNGLKKQKNWQHGGHLTLQFTNQPLIKTVLSYTQHRLYSGFPEQDSWKCDCERRMNLLESFRGVWDLNWVMILKKRLRSGIKERLHLKSLLPLPAS